jgi:hypothetical protein
MTKPIKTAAVSMALCVTLTGRPQAPAPENASTTGQTTAPHPAVPPEVDQALRERVAQFYRAMIDGKYRAADKFVAEDSKDAFIAMNKPRLKAFEITRIDYSDDFTKAHVALVCPGEWLVQGQKLTVKIPMHDAWKLEDGLWVWYVDQDPNVVRTPFGLVRKKDSDTTGTATEPPAIKDPKAAAKTILNLVSIDRRNVILKINRKDSADVLIRNGMPGLVEIRTESYPDVKGFGIAVDKLKLGPGETAKLTLRTEGIDQTSAPPDVMVNVFVDPINRVLPVSVKFVVAESAPPASDSAAPVKRNSNK